MAVFFIKFKRVSFLNVWFSLPQNFFQSFQFGLPFHNEHTCTPLRNNVSVPCKFIKKIMFRVTRYIARCIQYSVNIIILNHSAELVFRATICWVPHHVYTSGLCVFSETPYSAHRRRPCCCGAKYWRRPEWVHTQLKLLPHHFLEDFTGESWFVSLQNTTVQELKAIEHQARRTLDEWYQN